jgi:ABC-type nitrate/sulfonate/bicarbonate transport system permease component
LLFILWHFVTRYGTLSPLIFPRLETILKEFIYLIENGDLFMHAFFSLKRSFLGFISGAFFGIVSGILMGWSRLWEDFFDLLINFIRSIPRVALLPLLIVWFGLGDTPKILLIGLSIYFLTIIPTIEGVKNVDSRYIKSAKSMGASKWQILTSVIFPAALPSIFAGIRLSATKCISALVVVEIVIGDNGLGYLLQWARENLDMGTMFAILFILGILGYSLDLGMQYLAKILMPWRKGKTITI